MFFKPRSFAGIFGTRRSVVLAALTLTISSDGKTYAAASKPTDQRLCGYRGTVRPGNIEDAARFADVG
jgi:hypothetical protein